MPIDPDIEHLFLEVDRRVVLGTDNTDGVASTPPVASEDRLERIRNVVEQIKDETGLEFSGNYAAQDMNSFAYIFLRPLPGSVAGSSIVFSYSCYGDLVSCKVDEMWRERQEPETIAQIISTIEAAGYLVTPFEEGLHPYTGVMRDQESGILVRDHPGYGEVTWDWRFYGYY